MPKGKKNKTEELNPKTVKKLKASTKKNSKKKVAEDAPTKRKFHDELKLSESYMSLILGAIVVIAASSLFLFFLHESRKNNSTKPAVLNSSLSPEPTKAAGKTHTMQENETLWDVAVREYGDGFAYPRIVEANKDVITNSDFVPPGTVIVIPQ